jgi:hypothetical protein
MPTKREPASFPLSTRLQKAGMVASDQSELSGDEVIAIAKAARLNPKTELRFSLEELGKRQLIDMASSGAVSVLGVSSRKVLQETAALYQQFEPTVEEKAAIDIAEQTSIEPRLLVSETERVSDLFHLKESEAGDFLRRAQNIGFVDSEGHGNDRILFNGNLFRRDSVAKSQRILDSLKPAERQLVAEAQDIIERSACIEAATLRQVLGHALFDKLRAAGFYDVNTVSNDQGEHVFVTAPGAFHKFVDPMVDDAFDLAKALVAALTYGIAKSSPGRGRIMMPSLLISKLVSGREVGPATAIGQDYRVLEMRRVIQLRHAGGGLFFMRLLKRDIGELALQVLTHGAAPEQILAKVPTAAMTMYTGPEQARASLRRVQRPASRKHTADILQSLREQGGSW